MDKVKKIGFEIIIRKNGKIVDEWWYKISEKKADTVIDDVADAIKKNFGSLKDD